MVEETAVVMVAEAEEVVTAATDEEAIHILPAGQVKVREKRDNRKRPIRLMPRFPISAFVTSRALRNLS